MARTESRDCLDRPFGAGRRGRQEHGVVDGLFSRSKRGLKERANRLVRQNPAHDRPGGSDRIQSALFQGLNHAFGRIKVVGVVRQSHLLAEVGGQGGEALIGGVDADVGFVDDQVSR